MNASCKGTTNIVVSVAMITYNHERYIAQAIQSVLMQKTAFEIELVIGEDCSNDNTRSIVLEYAQKYPEKIHIILREHNLGIVENFASTLFACKGKYIAICEGDDYWTDPLKLQKQVDLMENNPEYSGCFHQVKVIIEDSNKVSHISGGRPGSQQPTFSLIDVVQRGLINTCSIMYRNNLITEFPDWYFQQAMGDFPLFVLLAQKGDFAFADEVMAVYRVHKDGNWSSRNKAVLMKQSIHALETIDKHLNFQYHEIIMPGIFEYWCSLANYYADRNYRKEGRAYFNKSCQNIKYMANFPRKKFIKILFNVYFTPLLKLYRTIRNSINEINKSR